MKLLAILIAIILFAGSLDFCQDSGDCDDSAKTEVCGPLCHCSGCVFSIVIPVGSLYSPLNILMLNNYEASLAFSIPRVSYSIWQPPRPVA